MSINKVGPLHIMYNFVQFLAKIKQEIVYVEYNAVTTF